MARKAVPPVPDAERKRRRSAAAAWQAENEELRRRLEESEETLAAIRSGAVDALVVEEPGGHRIYTLEGADRPYRLFVEEMEQGAATLHADGSIAWCNRRFATLLQMPQEKLTGANLRDFVFADHLLIYDNLARLGQRRSGRGEAHLRRADGAAVPAFLTFNALPPDCGSAMGVLVTDLTPQRHHEQMAAAHAALRESQRQLALVANTAPVFIAHCDMEGRYKFVNEPYAKRLGLTARDCIGKQLIEVLGPATAERLRPYIEVALAGQAVQFELELPYPRAGKQFMHCSYAPEFEADGKVVGFVAAITNITERRRVEQALRESEQKLRTIYDGTKRHADELETRVAERTADLQATNEQLEAFVHSVAHDLRSPLRSMAGFADLLVDQYGASLDARAFDFLRRIQSSSEFMDRLLLDLLAYGRTARAEIDLGVVEVRKAWEEALAQTRHNLEETNARVEVLGEFPRVRAHHATLGQCLANLLSNAAKFVAPGVQPRIRFRAEEVPISSHDPGRAKVRLWVEDNGIGIPSELQDRAFRVFERLHGARYAGTGVGLSIVRKGVERMGGRVGLESEPGRGSRFWIELIKAD